MRLLLSSCILFSVGGAYCANSQNGTGLAQASQNPISDLISVPFENNTNFNLGPFDRTQNVLDIKPVVPFKIGADWTLVWRTIVPLLLPQPLVNSPTQSRSGLGDINPEVFFVPPNNGEMMFGFGPSLITPTATSPFLGERKWSTGPTAVVVWLHKEIVAGLLATQVWSFAGVSYEPDVSYLSLQPFFNYNFPSGWFVYSNPVITANWHASSGNQWTVPLGAGFGKLFKVGKLPIKLSLAAFGNVVKPDGASNWSLQAVLSFLFPE